MSMMMVLFAFFVVFILFIFFFTVRVNTNVSKEMHFNPGKIDWDAVDDLELTALLDEGSRKIEAIKRYRELSGSGLKDAKETIEFLMANWDDIDMIRDDFKLKKAQRLQTDTITDSGIRDLIAEGRISEAERVYAAFAGVDIFTARDKIASIVAEMQDTDDDALYEARN